LGGLPNGLLLCLSYSHVNYIQASKADVGPGGKNKPAINIHIALAHRLGILNPMNFLDDVYISGINP
jgi:hypothetical protein